MIKITFEKIDDKFWHNIAGLVITIITTLLVWYFTPLIPFWSSAIGFVIGVLAGYIKEKLDAKKKPGSFSELDWFATGWGSLVGALIICVILLNI